MKENTIPTFAQVIIEAIKANNLNFYVSLPAKVVKADNSSQKVDVQPLLQKQYKNDNSGTNRPVISDVPVQYPSGMNGLAYVHVPLKKNDIGMLVFCDRSLDKYLASDGDRAILPDDTRTHDISDAFFLPGVNPWKKKLSDVSDSDITIKNDKMKILIKPDGTISFEGATAEMMTVISSFMGHIETLVDNLLSATVVTMLGSSPFTPPTIGNFTSDKASMSADKVNFDTLK